MSNQFENQVGGHSGIKANLDQSILMKPSVGNELNFYSSLPNLPELMELCPQYFGTLTENPEQNPEAVDKSKDTEPTTYLCLENLTHYFDQPTILDLKLGTKLYDHTAKPEKVECMKLKAKETTSFEYGIRMTGMKVYDSSTKTYKVYDRQYGYDLKGNELHTIFENFFPSTLGDQIRKRLASDLKSRIELLRNVIQNVNGEFIASSFLIVYEGDIVELNKRIQAEIELENKPELEVQEQEEDENEDEVGEIYNPSLEIKMIDFAHSFIHETKNGPDLNYLKGIDTTLELLGSFISSLN